MKDTICDNPGSTLFIDLDSISVVLSDVSGGARVHDL
jgi:hypothetical protein